MQYQRLESLKKFLKVKKSPIAGRGLFTERKLARGKVIFRGRRSEGCYLIQYLNHSCRPNSKFVERNPNNELGDLLVAKRNIRAGEEVTIDIQTGRWKAYYWPIVQSKGCRCPAHVD